MCGRGLTCRGGTRCGSAFGDLLSLVRSSPALTLVAYSPLLSGACVRRTGRSGPSSTTRGLRPGFPCCGRWLAETGATVNQVVLAWLMGGELPVIPLVGASSVAQLEESLGAVDLELTAAQRARLDEAH